MNQASYFCPQCRQQRLFQQNTMNHTPHLLASIFLCGIWLPIWILMALLDNPPWRCQFCGHTDGVAYLQNPYLHQQEAAAAAERARIKEQTRVDRAGSTVQEHVAYLISDYKGPLIAVGIVAGLCGLIIIGLTFAAKQQIEIAANADQQRMADKSVAQLAADTRIATAGSMQKELEKTLPGVAVTALGPDKTMLSVYGTKITPAFAQTFKNNAANLAELKRLGFANVEIGNGKQNWKFRL